MQLTEKSEVVYHLMIFKISTNKPGR